MKKPSCYCRRMLVLLALACLAFSAQQTCRAQDSASQKANPAEVFYRSDKVQTVHLTIDPQELKRMQAALPERISVRGSFRWNDISLENVAIRYKGNSSSGPKQQHKRSYLVKFNEYEGEQRFLGLRRASFDNCVQFGSLFSEPIITEILRDQGIPAHRCNYAKLFLNGEYQGVYGNVERIDETFLENHLPDPKGLLFKVDEGGPGGNLQFLGDDPELYSHTFEPETKLSKQSHEQLIGFIKLINQSKPGEFAKPFDAKMESDDFLRVTSVLLLAGAFDQLTGWNPHNYYLYHDGTHVRWRYLPWDLDVGFCEVAFGQIRVLDEWNAAWPIPGPPPNPLLEQIVADPQLLKRYRTETLKILDKYFEPEQLCAKIDAKYALIKEALQEDPFPPRRITNPSDKSYEDIIASMKTFIRKRYASAHQQLENPGPRPVVTHRPQQGPPIQLMMKVQRVQKAAEAMVRAGKDIRPIQKVMQKVGPQLQQGKLKEAEKLVDEALQVVEQLQKEGK